MANSTVPQDVYALMNAIASQATGRDDLDVVDTQSFVSVGELLLRTSKENTLNAISQVLSETIFSTRPYKGKLESLRRSQKRWGGQVRKIVQLYSEAEASENYNTDINPNQLADGQSIDHYKIKKFKNLQLNFYGTKLMQKHFTRFYDQLSLAFQSEAAFMNYIDDALVNFYNEIELLNETESRAVLINYIAGISAMGLTEVDLVAEYNTEFGTQYTRAQLLSTYLEDFMKFVASEIKIYSENMTDMSVLYHANLDGYEKIMRHTPKARQHMVMYNPIFIKAKSEVYASLFNPEYLDIGDFEGVNFWQSKTTPTAISCTPNILNTQNGESKTADTQIDLDYVLGVLYDDEALGIWPQFSTTVTSPMNAAGLYSNTYVHWRFNSYTDYTENGILFVLGEGGPADADDSQQ